MKKKFLPVLLSIALSLTPSISLPVYGSSSVSNEGIAVKETAAVEPSESDVTAPGEEMPVTDTELSETVDTESTENKEADLSDTDPTQGNSASDESVPSDGFVPSDDSISEQSEPDEADNSIPDKPSEDEMPEADMLSDLSVSDVFPSDESAVGAAALISIKDADITLKNAAYTGKQRKPSPVVKVKINDQYQTLKSGTDYTLTYKNNVNPGKATLVIQGIGKYTDSVTKYFYVKAPISKATVTMKAMVLQSSGDANAPVIKFQKSTLKENTHYTVKKTAKKSGDSYTVYTLVITGKGYYTGNVTKTYTRVNNTASVTNNKAYKLISALDYNACVGIGSIAREGAGLYIKKNDTSAESRKFIFKSCGSGKWKIVSQNNDYIVRSKDANASLSQVLVTKLEDGNASDQFKLVSNSDGSVSFHNVKSGYAVQVKDTKAPMGSSLYLNKVNAKAVSQKFYLIPVNASAHTYSGIYRITSSVNKDFVLSVKDGKKTDGANINLHRNENKDSQVFRLLYSGGNTYRIQCAHSYSVLDVTAAKYADFTNVQQYQWNGTPAQRWSVKKNSDGTLTFLTAGNTSFALDLYSGTAANNVNVDIYKSNGTKAQKWNLVKVSERHPARPTADELKYSVSGQDIVDYAKTWVGKISYTLGANGPLVAGGKSDCSWFIFRVLEHFDLMKQWHKSLEYGRGTVPNTVLVPGGIQNARPGDILVWDEGGDAGHVTIYAGNYMAVGCNGITNYSGAVEYRLYTEPCGRHPDAICRLTNLT